MWPSRPISAASGIPLICPPLSMGLNEDLLEQFSNRSCFEAGVKFIDPWCSEPSNSGPVICRLTVSAAFARLCCLRRLFSASALSFWAASLESSLMTFVKWVRKCHLEFWKTNIDMISGIYQAVSGLFIRYEKRVIEIPCPPGSKALRPPAQ